MAAGNFYGGAFFGGGFFGALPNPIVGGGGYNPSQGYSGHETRRRTPEDVRQARVRLGIIPEAAAVIENVAMRQADRLEVDQQKIYDELSRELALKEISFDAKYLEALNSLREILVADEIAQRLRQKMENEALMTLVVMAAAV